MASAGGLSALVTRACRDPDAAARENAYAELIRLLSIFVRGAMGSRLRDHRESADVCQSIAKSFVEDFEGGNIAFESEAALAAYLQRIVRSKLADLSRHDQAIKRGGADGPVGVGIAPGDSRSAPVDPSAGEAGPQSIALAGEALERALGALSEDERALVRLRLRGMDWPQIAQHLGRDAGTLRQQFSRAQRRIAGELREE